MFSRRLCVTLSCPSWLAKYLPQSNRGSASSKGCCADAGCKEGAVMKVTTIEQWDELKR